MPKIAAEQKTQRLQADEAVAAALPAAVKARGIGVCVHKSVQENHSFA